MLLCLQVGASAGGDDQRLWWGAGANLQDPRLSYFGMRATVPVGLGHTLGFTGTCPGVRPLRAGPASPRLDRVVPGQQLIELPLVGVHQRESQ